MTQGPPPYMGEFTDDDVAWVLAHGVLRRVRAGEAIITEGKDPSELFIILEGSFLVSSEVLDNPELQHMGRGELAGEMSYMNHTPPRASVRAEADGKVWCIRRQELDAKIAADAGFASRFHKVVSEFILRRLYELAGPGGEPEPMKSDSVAKVIELIEKMLRGEFP